MDLPNGRDAPNGGAANSEEKMRTSNKVETLQEAGKLQGDSMASHHGQHEEGLVSSLLTKLDALENGTESGIAEQNSLHHGTAEKDQQSKGVELADIAKDLSKIKRQNTITHALLGVVIVMTAVWQVNEVSFLLWVQRKLSNPFKSLGDMIKASLKLKGRKPAVLESSPLPPVGIPDVTRADLPTLVISGDHR